MAVNKAVVIPDTDKLESARKFKAEGNEYHKNKKFKRAVGQYHRALLHLKAIGQSKSSGLGAFMSEKDLEEMGYAQHVPENVRIEVTKLTADCYNNLAACLLQQPNPNYSRIVEYCDNVIELTPNNVKAYYRRGVAYCNLEKFEKALESFDQAEAEAGSKIDKGLKALLNKQVQICREGLRRQDQQLSKAYKGMFDRHVSKSYSDKAAKSKDDSSFKNDIADCNSDRMDSASNNNDETVGEQKDGKPEGAKPVSNNSG